MAKANRFIQIDTASRCLNYASKLLQRIYIIRQNLQVVNIITKIK